MIYYRAYFNNGKSKLAISKEVAVKPDEGAELVFSEEIGPTIPETSHIWDEAKCEWRKRAGVDTLLAVTLPQNEGLSTTVKMIELLDSSAGDEVISVTPSLEMEYKFHLEHEGIGYYHGQDGYSYLRQDTVVRRFDDLADCADYLRMNHTDTHKWFILNNFRFKIQELQTPPPPECWMSEAIKECTPVPNTTSISFFDSWTKQGETS